MTCTGVTYDGRACERAAVDGDRCAFHSARRKRCWGCGAVWGRFDDRTCSARACGPSWSARPGSTGCCSRSAPTATATSFRRVPLAARTVAALVSKQDFCLRKQRNCMTQSMLREYRRSARLFERLRSAAFS